jgi:hypothetical protein
MKVASIDVGLHTLSTIVEEFSKFSHLNGKILFTETKDLAEKEKYITDFVLNNLTKYLNSLNILKEVNTVIVEKQLGTKNIKAKRLENHIHSWFIICLPEIKIVLFPSKNKTKIFNAPKMSYYQRKKWSIAKTKEILLERKDEETIQKIFCKKKADDESDAFLQLQAWKLRNKNK